MRKNLVLLVILVALASFTVMGTLSRVNHAIRKDAREYEIASSVLRKPVTDLPGTHISLAYPRPGHRFRLIKDLFDRSSEVVVGIPVAKNSRQSPGPNSMILTDYDVKVLQTITGDKHNGRTIALEVPGGSVTLPDGTVAEMRMPDFWKNPEIGRAYIFFLSKKRNSPSKLVGGPQGLFQITPWPESVSLANLPDISTGRVVVPQVLDSDELVKNYNQKDVGSFLQEIKRMTKPHVLQVR
jgi:hypothetical protein